MPDSLTQTAPFPQVLADLITGLHYKPDWIFRLRNMDRGQGSMGLTLVIHIMPPDSYHPENLRPVNHYFPVPPAAYDMRSWRRWLLDRIADVDTHERCEFFDINGERPYAPSHGEGNDPYLIRELGTDIDQRMSFLNELNPTSGK